MTEQITLPSFITPVPAKPGPVNLSSQAGLASTRVRLGGPK